MKKRLSLAALAGVAAIFLVVVPAGAAPAAKETVIVDPVDAAEKARVDGGALRIGGAVELTGPVTISGPVSVRPALPEEPFVWSQPTSSGQFVFGPAPADEQLAITSVTVSNFAGDHREVTLVSVGVDPAETNCVQQSVPLERLQLEAPARETVHADYPSPFLFPQGVGDRPWCLQVFVNPSIGLLPNVTIVGFEP